MYLLVRHTVRDYDAWKPHFDGDATNRQGITKNGKIFRNADNPNEITILFEVEDMDKAKAMLHSEELKAAMMAGGVTGEPSVSFLDLAGTCEY